MATNQTTTSIQNEIIAKGTAKASGLAALPIPVIDFAGVTYIQVDMVKKLADTYGIDTSDTKKLLIGSVVSGLISKLVSEAIGSLAYHTNLEKLISESLIKATVAGFLTTVTGEVYDRHFRLGGTLENIKVEDYLDYVIGQWNSDKLSVDKIGSQVFDYLSNKYNV